MHSSVNPCEMEGRGEKGGGMSQGKEQNCKGRRGYSERRNRFEKERATLTARANLRVAQEVNEAAGSGDDYFGLGTQVKFLH